MDDEDVYGPEMYRLGFGQAVEMGMLTDYKVLILTVNQESVGEALQDAFARDGGELTLDDATRLIGCWNGLAKRGDTEHSFALDPQPMRRAVAFAKDIRLRRRSPPSSPMWSRRTSMLMTAPPEDADLPAEEPQTESLLAVEAKHVDGSMNAMERTELLDWLKETRRRTPAGCCPTPAACPRAWTSRLWTR